MPIALYFDSASNEPLHVLPPRAVPIRPIGPSIPYITLRVNIFGVTCDAFVFEGVLESSHSGHVQQAIKSPSVTVHSDNIDI